MDTYEHRNTDARAHTQARTHASTHARTHLLNHTHRYTPHTRTHARKHARTHAHTQTILALHLPSAQVTYTADGEKVTLQILP